MHADSHVKTLYIIISDKKILTLSWSIIGLSSGHWGIICMSLLMMDDRWEDPGLQKSLLTCLTTLVAAQREDTEGEALGNSDLRSCRITKK